MAPPKQTSNRQADAETRSIQAVERVGGRGVDVKVPPAANQPTIAGLRRTSSEKVQHHIRGRGTS
jgi:hypothetical protein